MAYVIFNADYFDATDLDIIQMLSNGAGYKEISMYLGSQPGRCNYSEIGVANRVEELCDLYSCRGSAHLIAFCIRKHIII